MTGGKFALLTAGLALGACAEGPSNLTIRPVGESAANMVRSGDGLAVARGQLALNNVGLALEEFRKVQFQRPNDPEPLAGIGDCYAVMSRFDLAQSNYESALALAPRDPKLLLGLAEIFELQGNAGRAAAARADAQAAIPKVAQPAPAQVAQVSAPSAMPVVGSLTVELPPARTALVSRAVGQPALEQHSAVHIAAATGSVTVALPPARPMQVQVAAAAPIAQTPAAPVRAAPVAPSQPAIAQPVVAQAVIAPVQAAMPSPAAPQMRDAVLDADLPLPVVAATAPLLPHVDRQPKLLAAALTIKKPAVAPAPARVVRHSAPATLAAAGPSLQRLSSGEVALVTGHAAWNARLPVQSQAAQSQAAQSQAVQSQDPAKRVQWIALNGVSTGIQVVNAARRQGLAASARMVLLRRGWHGIAVATAGHIVEHSYVVYPRGRSGLAKRLANQFAIRTRVAHGRSVVVLVLGRDRLGLARTQQQA